MRYMVTGGAGFIGTNLVHALLESGNDVVALDDFSNGLRQNLTSGRNLHIVEGDIRDREKVTRAAAGCDVVFHLAALGSVPRSLVEPARSYDVNVVGSCTVFQAASEVEVRRVVYASSSSVYGDSGQELKREGEEGNLISPYAASKAAVELAAEVHSRCYSTELLGLRFFNVYGPYQRPDAPYAAVVPLFTDALMRGDRPRIHGDGHQVRDFTHVADVVQALQLAATSGSVPAGLALNVSAGAGCTVLDLFRGLQAATGRFDIDPLHVDERPGDIRRSRADITAAQTTLGFQPTWRLTDGLKSYVDWYTQHHVR
jgi:UDP-N-acetylglucosamine/UDP-N-acetylgalactosamine 4-epimerase